MKLESEICARAGALESDQVSTSTGGTETMSGLQVKRALLSLAGVSFSLFSLNLFHVDRIDFFPITHVYSDPNQTISNRQLKSPKLSINKNEFQGYKNQTDGAQSPGYSDYKYVPASSRGSGYTFNPGFEYTYKPGFDSTYKPGFDSTYKP
jgi:hypothetical protein